MHFGEDGVHAAPRFPVTLLILDQAGSQVERTVDRLDYAEHGNLIRWQVELESAAGSRLCPYQAGPHEQPENLQQKRLPDTGLRRDDRAAGHLSARKSGKEDHGPEGVV